MTNLLVSKQVSRKGSLQVMPSSKALLFSSKYSNHSGLEVGDTYVARLKSYNYQPRLFQIIEIKETYEDGEPLYLYYGTYLGVPDYE